MSGSVLAPPPRAAAADALRGLLEEIGYAPDPVAAMLGTGSAFGAYRMDRAELAARTGAEPVLGALVRLLAAGEDLAPEAARAQLGAAAIDRLAAAGVASIDHTGRLHADVLLAPVDGLLITADRPDLHESAVADYVAAPGPASRALARLLFTHPLDQALDLGCGSGYLACLMAANSRRVLATDVNQRAVDFSRFNAALNRIAHLECRQSDLFSAVAEETFDLIACNPPYVISPDSTYVYRDGGPALCSAILAAAPAHLARRGTLVMGANWPHHHDRDWRQDLARWTRPEGCHTWALAGQTLSASDYAAVWVQQQTDNPNQAAERHRRWVQFLREQGIDRVGAGYLVLRRTHAAEAWFETRRMPTINNHAGASLDRCLRGRDLVHETDEAGLLAACLRPAPDLERVDRARLVEGRWQRAAVELRMTEGLMFASKLNPLTAALLEQLDGTTALLDAAARLVPAERLDARMRAGLAASARELLKLGLLEPVGPGA